EARLRAAAEQMAQLEQELAGLRRELEQRRLEDFSTLERELAEHRDEMLAEQQELREAHRRFAREMEESGRRQNEELGRTLDELFDDDRFVPLDEPPR
ncbi:MAG TPA: hypothetical protein VI942_13860, partial [Thermoanaerobaculia bacterium]|nr:hypothetical protein [Thermoanaerobaculia bacterium]